MVEFYFEGNIIWKNYDFYFMPCVGDYVVINILHTRLSLVCSSAKERQLKLF